MSDIRKWLKLMESVPATFAHQPTKTNKIKRDATVMVDPSVGGGTARFMHYTPNGALVEIKGVVRELAEDEYSLPERDYENPYKKGNDWFHASTEPMTIGTMRDKPEFRPGDMVKIADVYGSVIGPGFGVFVAYSTSGEDCIISFDSREIIVPTENVGSVVEQDAKDNFDQTDNDGNLSPMSLGSDNVKIEEPEMDQRDDFSKWMETVESALRGEAEEVLDENVPAAGCGCGSWDCPVCFPQQDEMPGLNGALPGMGGMDPSMGEVCPTCGHAQDDGHAHDDMVDVTIGQDRMDPTMFGMEEDADSDTYDKILKAVASIAAAQGKTPDEIWNSDWMQEWAYSLEQANPTDQELDSIISTGNLPGRLANLEFNVGDDFQFDDNLEEEPEAYKDASVVAEKPRSGKGVKLGDIVQSYRPVDSDSPFTHGGDNLGGDGGGDGGGMEEAALDEMIPDGANPDDYGRAGRYSRDNFDLDETSHEMQEMADKIIYMQDMGLSKDSVHYTPEELASYTPEEMKECYDRVMGTVSEMDDMMQDPEMDMGSMNMPAAAGGGQYPPGTAPTMPESIQQGKPTMENIDKDIQTWLGRFKDYDALRASKAPVMEKKKPDFPDLDKDGDKEESISKAAKDKAEKVDEEGNPWEKLASKDDKKDEKRVGDSHKTAKGGTVTKTEKGLKHTRADEASETADAEVLEWMGRFAKLGNMKGYGR